MKISRLACLKLQGVASPLLKPSLIINAVYSAAQFWAASLVPYKLRLRRATLIPSPSSQSSRGISMYTGLMTFA